MYSIKNKDDIELSVRPQNTLSKWNETSNSRIMSIGGKYNKKISKKQRGGGDPSSDDCPICLEPLNEGTIIDVHKSVEARKSSHIWS